MAALKAALPGVDDPDSIMRRFGQRRALRLAPTAPPRIVMLFLRDDIPRRPVGLLCRPIDLGGIA